MNSSPPKRATVSPARTLPRTRVASSTQEPVAGAVPEGVVDGLEVIEVEKEQGEVARLAMGLLDREAQAVVEESAGGQAREVVVIGELAEGFLRLVGGIELGLEVLPVGGRGVQVRQDRRREPLEQQGQHRHDCEQRQGAEDGGSVAKRCAGRSGQRGEGCAHRGSPTEKASELCVSIPGRRRWQRAQTPAEGPGGQGEHGHRVLPWWFRSADLRAMLGAEQEVCHEADPARRTCREPRGVRAPGRSPSTGAVCTLFCRHTSPPGRVARTHDALGIESFPGGSADDQGTHGGLQRRRDRHPHHDHGARAEGPARRRPRGAAAARAGLPRATC